MPKQDEPAYMLAARSNTREGVPSSGYIVEKLLQRIDRLEKADSLKPITIERVN